jgi:tRNA threonylcarbamoyladenosine biosynthesis protein TsaB
MKILAIESMGRLGSVAALESGKLLAEKSLDPGRRSAETMTPAIGEILEQLGWQPQSIDLIAVVTGPGSFTGLRIGVTTAKVLAYAADAEVIGVDALEVIASQVPTDIQRTDVVVDAQRQQFFTRTYNRDANGAMSTSESMQIMDIDTWLSQLSAGYFVSGPGLAKIADRIPDGVIVADRDLWEARAATVGTIGYERYQQGHRDDVWKLLPEYGRRSAAEEKADAQA